MSLLTYSYQMVRHTEPWMNCNSLPYQWGKAQVLEKQFSYRSTQIRSARNSCSVIPISISLPTLQFLITTCPAFSQQLHYPGSEKQAAEAGNLLISTPANCDHLHKYIVAYGFGVMEEKCIIIQMAAATHLLNLRSGNSHVPHKLRRQC